MKSNKEKGKKVSRKKCLPASAANASAVDDGDLLHLGSQESFEAIFKNSKCTPTLSSADLLKAEEDMLKFWNKPSASSTKGGMESSSKANDKKEKVSKPSKKIGASKSSKSKRRETIDDLDASFETEELIREAEAMCRRSQPVSPKRTGTIAELILLDKDDRIAPKRRGKRAPKKEKVVVDEDIIVLSEDEVELEEDFDLGRMLLFHAELENQKYPIRMYELQRVAELRAMVADKTKVAAELLQMFLGDYMQLENNKTLSECGIDNLCTIEVYILQRSPKELYEQGSSSILRFKIQTSDRRGRQDCYVYVPKTAPMQVAVEQYAKDMGLNPTSIKLKFDGDYVDLTAKPEDCDLEGDECLDLISS